MHKTWPTFNPRWTVTLAVVLVAGLAPISDSLAQPAKPFAVTVNGELQPAERGELLFREHLARGAADTPQLQSLVRETLINQALMAQEALKGGLDKQPQVRARLDLARQGALAQAWQQQILQELQISDADLQVEYQRQTRLLGAQEVRLRHVLVADEKVARQVQDKLAGGAMFEQVAAEFSRDPGTRAHGGLSDWVPEGLLAPGIARALQGLKNGQLAAAPVETAVGWQVVRLDDRRPLTLPSMESTKPQLRQSIAKQALEVRLKALRAAARVE